MGKVDNYRSGLAGLGKEKGVLDRFLDIGVVRDEETFLQLCQRLP